MKRTKIVCTLGPACNREDVLRAMIDAGMNVARFNFSHGTHEDHARNLDLVRRLSAQTGKPIAALADLQGPKIRCGRFAGGPVTLVPGAEFTITTRDVPGDVHSVSTTYAHLPADVQPGEAILLADGLLQLKALRVTATDVICEVVDGGPLSNNKGINLPQTKVSAPALTDKDREDLAFALAQGFDAMALSFVRRPEDVLEARRVIHVAKRRMPVIAKIERAEAVDQIEAIIHVSDGVMIARGDMGVELPPEQVPVIQKRILDRCNQLGVPVITATQMLESMTENPRPTRAEASDVANAIFDGSDAVMLSGETAAGKYPLEAVRMMARIIERAEESRFDNLPNRWELDPAAATEDVVAQATAHAADVLRARVVATYTMSGSTAARVSKYRPQTPIVALTPSESTARRLAMRWGVEPVLVPSVERFEDLFPTVERTLLALGLASRGDVVLITAGVPLARPGTTNCIKVHRIETAAPEVALAGPSSADGVTVDRSTCIGCGLCVRVCPEAIFTLRAGTAIVDPSASGRCMRDGLCVEACPVSAIGVGPAPRPSR